jgi:ATP-dependent Zn protease
MSEISILKLQIEEQQVLINKYKAAIHKKDELLLELENILEDTAVDYMIDQERGK